jgi:HD-GYP domain-containing protein (c-di-GMP phosphodiesterase class II)
MQELRCSENIGLSILQHHERFDGTGYTQALSAGHIVTGAKIISVADAFDAMISKKPYRKSFSGYEAMKNLLSDNSCRFDPDVLGAFVKIMGMYPIGQEVLLNNGAVAKIVGTYQTAPLRPQVVILKSDEAGTLGEGQYLDLLKSQSLFIHGTFVGEN